MNSSTTQSLHQVRPMHPIVNRVRGVGRLVVQLESLAAWSAKHDYHHVFEPLRQRLHEVHGSNIDTLRVLDFGCGYTYPLVLLFEPHVKEITGIDIDQTYRLGLRRIVAAQGGILKPGRALVTLLKHLRMTRYYRHLERMSGVRARHDAYQLVQYEGGRLPFEDGSFDCIISNGVLQELPCSEMSCYAQDMARVLRPGGTIDLEWHNFYSWAGHCRGSEALGHEMPWGHLSGGPYMPSLNRMKPEEILDAFSSAFTDLQLLAHDRHHRVKGQDSDHQYETEAYLTPDVAARLAEYPRELLLTRGYILQGRRR